MNRQQREFRKRMKQIEKENQLAGVEPLSYRYENYRPRRHRKSLFVGGGGIVAFLIILWNLFAVSTWIRPHVPKIGPSSVASLGTTPTSNALGTNTQREVNDYIQASKSIDQALGPLVQPFLSPSNLNNISVKIFDQATARLNSMKQTTVTNLTVLEPLQNYELGQIQIMESVLQQVQAYKINHAPSEWQTVQQLIEKFDVNQTTEQSILISILDKEHMPYRFGHNGEIQYQYH
ncbi:hypothetical protein [Alicyclobacillus sp. ALC3]|uniref:hypothetical protein n=1 Tax=Alicyclobacillus sp. ALC3 TaxID=2796143 RepID=UPI002378AEC7|nr:hypothetical protein [Alicyclobacillus sp. ALC3]WDL98403.1 hypothetical protein JC200_06880 [Alicyclobacillus sp. ALC3]